jgi:calcineurin-like phosphoesterase family protein
MSIFLSSDLHFFHDRDFIYKSRNFSSVDEMNKKIVENWNSLVQENDTVYILGDCVLGGKDFDSNLGLDLLRSLNGQKYLAIGNHDTDNKIKLYKENNIFQDIQFGYRLRYKKISYLLTHYPTICGNGESASRVWNLHGHTHSKDIISGIACCYNVALDAHNCFPVPIETINQDIKNFRRLNIFNE